MTKMKHQKIFMPVRFVLLFLITAVMIPEVIAQTAPGPATPGRATGQKPGQAAGQTYGQPGQAPGQTYGQPPQAPGQASGQKPGPAPVQASGTG